MKKFFLLFLIAGTSWMLHAQVPQGISYQAVARDQSGDVLKNTNMTVRLAILQGGPDGTVVWQEDHPVTTNDFGLFSLMIGDPGASVTGGNLSSFDEIDWSLGDYYLRVSMDAGEGFQSFDPVPFLSVPYARMAGRVAGSWSVKGDTLVYTGGSVAIGTSSPNGSKLAVQGDDLGDNAGPLFEVKRKDGQTVFAVYNDSIRMYVDATPGKGPRGGFAIGGFDAAKGPGHEYLRITPDSVRIYIDQSKTKGPRGGFAIGGFDAAKGGTDQLMHLNKENYFIGHQSGVKTTTGINNVFFGNHAGYSNTSGSTNIFLGFESGYNNTTGSDNILLGYHAGHNITAGRNNITLGNEAGYRNDMSSNNIFLGKQAGYNHIYGNEDNTYHSDFNIYIGHKAGYGSLDGDSSNLNIFIGNKAGYSIKSGSDNIFIGDGAGYSNVSSHWNVYLGLSSGGSCKGAQNVFVGGASGAWADGTSNCYIGAFAGRGLPEPNLNTGDGNVFMGYYSGIGNSTGSYNVFIGLETGENNGAGNNNVYIGNGAAQQNAGSGNVFIGAAAGYNETSASNKLIISNNVDDNLIEGDFQDKTVTINNVLTLTPRANAPDNPREGELYVGSDGTGNHIYCFLNGNWVQLDK